MSTSKRICIACLLVAAGLIGRTDQATGQGREPAAQTEVRGLLKDLKAGTIILSFGGGREVAATEKTYTLAKDVEVCVSAGFGGGPRGGGVFKEAALTELAAGTAVILSLSADLKTVDSIVAEEPTVRGLVKAVNAAKHTLTISTPNGSREQPARTDDKTYTVAADAEIAIDDGRGRRNGIKEGKLADLSEGAVVTLRLALDKNKVHGILAEGPTLGGAVKAIDPAKRSITVTLPARGDDAGEERTLAIAKDAVVLVDDGKGRRLSVKETKLDDVPLGAMVMLKLSVDQGFVMTLRAEGPTLLGLLKGVDAEKGTITIAIPRGRNDADEKTLTLAKDARVTFDGNATRLADLKVGDNGPTIQLRLALDQKTVQVVTVRQPRRA